MCFDLQYCMLLAEVHDLPHNNKHLNTKQSSQGSETDKHGAKNKYEIQQMQTQIIICCTIV